MVHVPEPYARHTMLLMPNVVCLQIYPHGSDEESDTLEADFPETSPQLLPPSLTLESDPRLHSSVDLKEGRVHSKAYPTSSQLRSGAKLPRVEFPKVHAAVFSAPDWAGEKMEGQMRGGFPRVSSHPENLADLAAAASAKDTPFARCGSAMLLHASIVPWVLPGLIVE